MYLTILELGTFLALFVAAPQVSTTNAEVPIAGKEELLISGTIEGASGPLKDVDVALFPILSEYADGLLVLEDRAHPEAVAVSRTDSDGRFRLVAPQAGMWRILAKRDGFVPMSLDLAPLVEERYVPDLHLALARNLEIQVLSHDGSPVAGARLFVPSGRGVELRNALLQPIWKPARRVARSNAEGKLSIPVADTTDSSIEIAADGFSPRLVAPPKRSRWTIRLDHAAPEILEVAGSSHRPAPDVLVEARASELPLGRTNSAGRLTTWPSSGGNRLRLLSPDGAALEANLAPPKPGRSQPNHLDLPPPRFLTSRVLGLPERRPIQGAIVWRDHAPGGAVRTDAAGAYRLAIVPWYDGALRVGASGYLTERLPPDAPVGGEVGPTLVLHPVASISGIVVDREGQPLEGAEIRTRFDRRSLGPLQINPPAWQRQSGAFVRSRKDGRFRLGNLVPGLRYELRVELGGFSPRQVDASAPQTSARQSEVKIVMDRGLRAIGRVLDPQSRTIAGARVVLSMAKAADILDQFQREENPLPRFTAWTDGDGRFELAALPAEKLELEVEAEGFASVTVPRLTLEASDKGPTDLGTIVLSPEAVVAGKVEDPAGKPLAGVAVTRVSDNPYLALAQARANLAPDTFSGSDGIFVLGGLYAGQAVKLRFDLDGYAVRVLPLVKPDRDPIGVVMTPTRTLSGIVVGPDRSPIAGASVLVFTTDQVQLSGAQTTSATRPTSLLDRTGEDGRFQIDGVDPGLIDLAIYATGWQDWERRIDPWRDRSDGEVEVELKPAAVVEGEVLDGSGQPAIGAEIRRWEPPTAPGEIRFRAPLATADGDGAFRIENISPGRARLEARLPGLGRAVREIDVLAGENVVDFQLEASGGIAGSVIDELGVPVPGAEVVVRSNLASWTPPRTVTDSQGAFKVAGLTTGSYALDASKPGMGKSLQPVSVEVRAEPVDDVVIELTATGAVTGRLEGLSLADLSKVRIDAGALLDIGTIDFQGDYRIEGLLPGAWAVTAEIPGSGRQATGTVRLEKDQPEAHLDLDFGAGFTLSGEVVATAGPVAGATVTAFGPDGVSAWAETDEAGSFQLSGLPGGDYVVEVAVLSRSIKRRQPVSLDTDRNIIIDLSAADGGKSVGGLGTGGRRLP